MNVSFFSLVFLCITVAVSAAPPQLADDRLEIRLFAQEPDIVTPIGMAIDRHDRLFILESHTHHPPKDYQGPKRDRVKVFEDADSDGVPEKMAIFAKGINQGMNLAFSPEGVLYAVCAREVLALPDRDSDGVCDGIERILTLDTTQRYAHNSLLGITFDREGWLYISRGNTGSDAWKIVGKDGSVISGYGDGGNVFRCRPDGTQVSEVATGFWNGFNLKFDMDGRLLLVDNDPDARGPNRLVHLVEGGDYGYQSVYGGGGNHPFQGWDGSLPGTLGYVAGTGEAPSDLIDWRRTAFPRQDYVRILATIWNENTIEQYDLRKQGKTLVLEKKNVFLSGGKNFRPVALEADSKGRLYLTDWVLVDYPNHGRGRIWRISPKSETKVQPKAYFDYEAINRTTAMDLLVDREPPEVLSLLEDRQDDRADKLKTYLKHPSTRVRQAALRWAGASLDTQLKSSLDLALEGTVHAPLFATFIAALENLSGSFADDFRHQRSRQANKLKRSIDPAILSRIVDDESFHNDVRALALKRLNRYDRNKLNDFARVGRGAIQLVAIQKLGAMKETTALSSIAKDQQIEDMARGEALLALASQADLAPDELTDLLEDRSPEVALEAARTLRWHVASNAVRQAFEKRFDSAKEALAEQLQIALRPDLASRPQTPEAWKAALAVGGDPARGRRVFHTPQFMCARCHTVDGDVALLGPSLAGIAQSVTREQIIHSILRPSDQFPPQYQAWIVRTQDGVSHQGLQLDHKAHGAIELLGLDAKTVRFEAEEIADYEASPHSLMPPGLEHLMTVSEFRDLVSYLCSLK